MSKNLENPENPERANLPSDVPFFSGLGLLAFLYIGLILALIAANISVVSWADLLKTLGNRDIQASLRLTLFTCTVSAMLALLFAVPIGYLLARFRFWGRSVLDAVLDIPIVLPPLVVGLSLLILFNKISFSGQNSLERWLNAHGISVTFSVLAVILAQFAVTTAFAARLVKNTFDQMDSRREDLALTMGCHRAQAFWRVALPQARQGLAAAGILAWARALGEFGPVLVFAGATRGADGSAGDLHFFGTQHRRSQRSCRHFAADGRLRSGFDFSDPLFIESQASFVKRRVFRPRKNKNPRGNFRAGRPFHAHSRGKIREPDGRKRRGENNLDGSGLRPAKSGGGQNFSAWKKHHQTSARRTRHRFRAAGHGAFSTSQRAGKSGLRS